MTYATMVGGLNWPNVMPSTGTDVVNLGTSPETAMAAATDKLAYIGYAYVENRGTGKVVSAAGGGSIVWKTSTVTWANGGTTIDLGLQGWATGAGPLAQPDGTFGVKRTLTGGDGNITSNAIKTTAMTGGSGTSTISHGDKIALVWDMTARAGADSVIVMSTGLNSASPPPPLTNAMVSGGGVWKTTGGRVPNAYIVSDDGTLIKIADTVPFTAITADAFADATNPDERGMVFQVPWNCKIDGLWMLGGHTDAASDFTLTLYSDHLGTPTSMGSFSVLGEQSGAAATDRYRFFPFTSEVTLAANMDYVVAARATGATNVRLPGVTLMSAAQRVLNCGGTTVQKVTRDGGAGVFTEEVAATQMYWMGVRISSLNISGSDGVYTV
jgi:hypothetical protein